MSEPSLLCEVSSDQRAGNDTKPLLMSSRDDMGAMNRYVTLQPLGDGTYGSVMLGQRVDTGEKVTPTLCFVVGNIKYQIK